MNTVNAFYEQVRGGLLKNHAASAKAHGTNIIAVVLGGGEHDYASRQRIEIDFLEHGEAVFIGHAEIEEQDFRLEFGEELDALGAVLGFADDGDVVVSIEELAKAIAKDSVVIG